MSGSATATASGQSYSGTATGMIYWGTDDDGKLTYGPSQASGGNHSSPISLGYSGSTSSQNKTIDVTFKKEFTSVTFGPGTGDVSLSASGLANEA